MGKNVEVKDPLLLDSITPSVSDGTAQVIHEILRKSQVINVVWNDQYWMKYVNIQANNQELSESQRAYYRRIQRVKDMPILTEVKWNPVNMVYESIVQSDYFHDFQIVRIPEVVDEYTTFDLFNFPDNHVARRPSDSYFIEKSEEKEKSILLRPHTSVMWKFIMDDLKGKEQLEQVRKLQYLSAWKVYRVDDIDPTHHECFHQIDWLKVVNIQDEVITQATLKGLLSSIIYSIFGEDIEYRFLVDNFPYTKDSLQVEVMFDWRWLEVLWAGIVHPTVMDKLWLDSSKYNGWAFGFWIERLAMALKKIPDIRLFWSNDQRVTKQWWNYKSFENVSSYPPVYKDISFIVPKTLFQKSEISESNEIEIQNEADLFAIAAVVRDIAWDLVEEVRIVDMFENDRKFSSENKSVSIKITFRSLERTLTNEEINTMYFQIRNKIESELGYSLR